MRPSKHIKDSYRQNIQDRAITLKYYAFLEDRTITDDLTGEPVQEGLAYADPIELPAWVEENPGRAHREAFGLQEERFILAQVHMDELVERDIVLHIGDKFEHDNITYFLEQSPQRTGQNKGGYVLINLALMYKEGRSEVKE